MSERDAIIDRIARGLGSDLWRFAEGAGFDMHGARPQPNGLWTLCNEHGDKNPSLSITLGDDETPRCRCFGCGWTADAFGMIASARGLTLPRDFAEVKRIGAELAGVSIDDTRPTTPRPAPRLRVVPPPAPRFDVDQHDAQARVLAHLGALDDSDIARATTAYLSRRGLLDAARRDGWFAAPPHAGRILRDSFLEDATGLYNRLGSARNPYNPLGIPWRTRDGRIEIVQTRRIDAQRDRKYLFPEGRKPSWPYGVERLAGATPDAPLVIVEGAVDVLAFRILDGAESARIVLGVPGVSVWLDAWDELVRGRKVWIAFDVDDAGERAVPGLATTLDDAGATDVLRLRPKGGGDWAEIVERLARGENAA